MSSSQHVLSLYKRIMRLAKVWEASIGSETAKERAYISAEAHRLFKQNKTLTDKEAIEAAIKEGESRLEIAVHYRNPWPRPTHIPQHSMLPLTDRKKKKTDRILGQSKPAYMRSYDIGDKNKTSNS